MKKIINVLLLTIILASSTVFAKEVESEVVVKEEKPSYKAILLGDDKGKIYYSENIDEKYPLASLTKMMTLMVTFDQLEKGSIKMKDKIKVSKKSAQTGGSRIPMKEGEVFTLEDLIKATAIYSANNAAYAIAEYIGKGDVDKFVKMMNKKSIDLGLEKELEFYTPAGLPSDMTKKGMDSGTTRGIYKLSLEAAKYSQYMDIASMKEATIHDGKLKIKNRNLLLGEEGIYGIKTGHHSKVGYNISVLSDKESMQIFTVVVGGPTYKKRDESVLKKMEEFYEHYQFRKLTDKNIAIAKVPIFSGDKEYTDLYPDKSFTDILNKDSDIKISIKRNKGAIAPVEAGKVLGEYKVVIDGNVVETGKLITKEEIKLSISLKNIF
ncbi:D-alanyl-D-alanine carboxypeptidase family protein [Fusobacterium varium]